MPDTPFKSMTRERRMYPFPAYMERLVMERCEKCGGMVGTGDWPWCKGSPQDHER